MPWESAPHTATGRTTLETPDINSSPRAEPAAVS